MLPTSRRVEIVEAKAVEGARRRLADVVAWLARHGVEANGSTALADGTEAKQLAAVAKDVGADLIVAGAFGHSRLPEWAFGGVTRDLLLFADRCVFASH
jgi:nucleotide-binding universal stress UspA family protein